ncbi:MAG: acylphosphatase [Agarilytica sp.]
MEAIQGRVEGKVQGVGFRCFTQECARELGLSGYVQNLPDGAVAFFIQGAESNLQSMLKMIESGPDYAKVSQVTYERVAATFSFPDFDIR